MIRDRILKVVNRISDTLHRMETEPTMMACPVSMTMAPSNVTPFPMDKVSTRTGVAMSGTVLPFIRK